MNAIGAQEVRQIEEFSSLGSPKEKSGQKERFHLTNYSADWADIPASRGFRLTTKGSRLANVDGHQLEMTDTFCSLHRVSGKVGIRHRFYCSPQTAGRQHRLRAAGEHLTHIDVRLYVGVIGKISH